MDVIVGHLMCGEGKWPFRSDGNTRVRACVYGGGGGGMCVCMVVVVVVGTLPRPACFALSLPVPRVLRRRPPR